MSTTRIVCTEQSAPSRLGHGHIVAVGVGNDPSRASSRQTVSQVRTALANGDVYYTVSPSSGKVALVHRYDCPCGILTIRSAADAVSDNNLDNLRLCNFN